MPVDARSDRERVFNDILELNSFNQTLGQPTVSNWFAWNSMAKSHMREFSATKYVFAAVCTNGRDLDEEDTFDSVTSDPKAQLQAILKGNGGIPIAFS